MSEPAPDTPPATVAASRDGPLLRALGATASAVVAWPYLSGEAAEAFAAHPEDAGRAEARVPHAAPNTPPWTRSPRRSFQPTIIRRARGPRASPTTSTCCLSESDAQTTQTAWTGGPRRRSIEASAVRFKAPFAKASGAQQAELLTELSEERARSADAARQVLQGHQGRHHSWLLHLGDWHPQGAAVQGQSVPARVRRLHASRARLRACPTSNVPVRARAPVAATRVRERVSEPGMD